MNVPWGSCDNHPRFGDAESRVFVVVDVIDPDGIHVRFRLYAPAWDVFTGVEIDVGGASAFYSQPRLG